MSRVLLGPRLRGDTGLPKWGNILYLMKKRNLVKALYIGDTLKDKNETEKAGIPFIHAAYGFGEFLDCPHAIARLSDFPQEAGSLNLQKQKLIFDFVVTQGVIHYNN
jgi:phosphoglycolate phosphatase-like HAD superfamily hydrolase